MKIRLVLTFLVFALGLNASWVGAVVDNKCTVNLPKAERKHDEAIKNTVTIGKKGKWVWNGMAVKKAEIPNFLNIVRNYKPAPLTLLSWQKGANCADVKAAEKMLVDSGVCESGGCVSYGAINKLPRRETLQTLDVTPLKR